MAVKWGKSSRGEGVQGGVQCSGALREEGRGWRVYQGRANGEMEQ